MNFPPTSPPTTHLAPRNALPVLNRVHSRGVMATATAASAKAFTEAEKNACSLDAMLNGGTCKACQ